MACDGSNFYVHRKWVNGIYKVRSDYPLAQLSVCEMGDPFWRAQPLFDSNGNPKTPIDCAVPSNFFENVNIDLYTVSYDTSPLTFHRWVTPQGNYATGYFSDQAKCNKTPGALPGIWAAPNQWQSTCHGVGVKRELTQLELHANACSGGEINQNFCNSLTDQGGNPRKPLVCGGTDANIYTYNPVNAALEGLGGTFTDLSNESDQLAAQLVQEQRKRIFTYSAIGLLVALIIYLIVKW